MANNFQNGPGGRLIKAQLNNDSMPGIMLPEVEITAPANSKNVDFGYMRPKISPLNQKQFMQVARGEMAPRQTGMNAPIVFGQEPGSIGEKIGQVLSLGKKPYPGQGFQFTPLETLKQTAIDFATGEAIGAGVKAAAPYVKAAYNKVATGNSVLPIAWKLEKNMASPSQIAAIKNSANLTDEEAGVLSKYMNNPYSIAKNSRESEILASIPQKSSANLSGINQPVTKIQNYYVAEGANPQFVGKYGENVSYPRGRSWSLGAGRTEGYANTHRNTRLVIPSRYANKLEGFHAVDYNDPRFSFLAPEERELFGNVPEGFKVIGNSNEEGFKNIFIKPNRNVNEGVLQKIAKRMSF
jgi:hypothetical protein